jgi:hypothetical protein
MDTFDVQIAPGTYLDDAAMNMASFKSATAGETIVATAKIESGRGLNAAFFAIQRKSDGAIFARLAEWTMSSDAKLHINFRDETEGFPEHRAADLSILQKLTPTTDVPSLIWRDRARFELAQAGAFRPVETAAAPNSSAGQSSSGSTKPQQVLQRTRELPAPQQAAAEKTESPAKAEKRGLKILVDRTPGLQPASTGGNTFLRFTGYIVETARFVSLIAFGAAAKRLAADIGKAIEKSGGAELEVEGTFEQKRGRGRSAFRIHSFSNLQASELKIPERAKEGDEEKTNEISGRVRPAPEAARDHL